MSNHSLPLSVVSVSGEDAITFLQGQLTQDIANLNKQWKYAAQCSPQGRVIAFFIVFEHQNNIYLITDDRSCQQTLTQLEKYVMRSKVSFDVLDQSAFFVDKPANAEEIEGQHVEFNNGVISLQQSYGDLLICSDEQATNLETSSENLWRQANIKNKLAFPVGKALGKFTPEAINLDLAGAISFTKGCYTGQEIVARMHYLGKAKKRLFFATIIGKLDNIRGGDNITDKEGKTIGHLVNFEDGGSALISIKVTEEPTLNKSKKTIQSINGELLL